MSRFKPLGKTYDTQIMLVKISLTESNFVKSLNCNVEINDSVYNEMVYKLYLIADLFNQVKYELFKKKYLTDVSISNLNVEISMFEYFCCPNTLYK